ncbi:MAG TPA: hypothetical protein VGI70_01205 [Polyangiales bacterium]
MSSTSEQPLFVRCQTWLEFIEHYASDLARGRLYVASETPPAVMTVLDLKLQLPEASELVLRARVVQVLAAEPASAAGQPPGIGLELVDMDADRKLQIAQLVEFAERQREHPDPNASFTRTLLELSPPLAAAEVGYRLSLIPGATPRSSDGPKRRSSADDNRPDEGRPRRAESRPIEITVAQTSQPSAQPIKPTDPIKLKVLLTEFAHKRYEIALRHVREMLEDNPGDPQALRWQHMCNARLAVSRNDPIVAADQYEMALAYDEDNREAREYVRTHRRDKKLNSIPFGRYFTKKK